MPRLIGKRSNTGSSFTLLILFVAIAGVLLEYFGAINIIPGFGREGRGFEFRNQSVNEQMTGQTNH
jgi:hypothetical protein